MPVIDRLGTVDLALEPDDLGVDVERLRVFAGYAGWAPDQLDGELEAGGWFVVDADADDPFFSRPDDLWAEVLRRQRGPLSWFASCPIDPSVN